MSTIQQILDTIDNVIVTNTNREITEPLLNALLKDIANFSNNEITNKSIYTIVDDINGDDDTGIRNDVSKPFKTPKAAQDAVQEGDNIFVKAGTYVTNTTNLGKNNVDWFFQFGSWLKPSDLSPMWIDASASYNVYGFGKFGDSNTLNVNNSLIQFSDTNSTIHFHCRSIEHKSNISIISLAGGGNKVIDCDGDIVNHNTNDLGSSLVASGNGYYTVTAKNINTNVGGLSYYGNGNGTCLFINGFTGIMTVNADVEKLVDGSSSVIYSRTNSTGRIYLNGNLKCNAYTSPIFFRAVIFHQGGHIEHTGNIKVGNSPAFYSNNLGAVNFFYHKSGIYKTSDFEAIRLHDTLAKNYQFDGVYESNGAANTVQISGNITGSRVDIGKYLPALFHNRYIIGASVKSGIQLTAAYTLFIGNAKIICDDTFNGEAITATVSVNAQIDHSLVSNVDKNVNVTSIIASKFNFNTAIAV